MSVPTAPGSPLLGVPSPTDELRESRLESDAHRRKFVEAVNRQFTRCTAKLGEVKTSYTIGGRSLTLRLAGPALGPLLGPALAHLATQPVASPDLTVCAWDTTTTGIAAPPPPWNGDQYLGNGEIRGWNTRQVHAAFDVPCGMLSLFDVERRLAFLWVRNLAALPGYVIAAPFRVIFQWWAADRGMQLAHAAAVGTERGGVLLAGLGGAGKSTTALLAMLDGLLYAGDDYVLVEPGSEPRVHSLYNSGKLDPLHLTTRLAGLSGVVEDLARSNQDKAIVFVHRHWPERIAPSFPIRAILVPRVTGSSQTCVIGTTAGDALRALLPHSIFPLPGARHAALDNLTRLVRGLPVFRLELGTDMRAIPEAIREVLGGIPA